MTDSRSGDQGSSPSPRERLLTRIAEQLVCPHCKGPLEGEVSSEAFRECIGCGTSVQRRDGQFVLGGFTQEEVKADWLNRIKEFTKRRLGRFYPLAIQLLSPVQDTNFVKPFLGTFDLDRDLVVDLGSGTSQYGDRVVCVDGVGYENVHIVGDLERLPVVDGSFAGVISVAVLEHTVDPHSHVEEIQRTLRPGGRVLCFIPFMQGYHASPHDYQRYTISGLRQLFSGFEVVDVRVGAGPTSGMLWVLQEWFALLFSFGSERLYRLLLPLMWVFSPLKYLDLLLARHPAAQVIASGFVIEARKPLGAA